MHKPLPPAANRPRALLRRLLAALCALAALGAALYLGTRALEASARREEPRGDLTARFIPAPTVLWQGASYAPRKRLTSLLLLGVDRPSDAAQSATPYRNGGQADFLMLLVVDHEQKRITPIQIDRDTLAQVTTLGVLGNVTGMRSMQICLSHGFGDGGITSAALTRDAVQRLLLGADVSFTLAMNLDGIAVLNDALGGVPVTLLDDFTALDPAMRPGVTLTLRGKQAEYFVRNRRGIGVGTNASRNVRQQVYWQGLSDALAAYMARNGGADALDALLDTLQPYLVTDIPRGRLINEAWSAREYTRSAPVQPQGTYALDAEGFVAFTPDADSLMRLVMDTFFSQVP